MKLFFILATLAGISFGMYLKSWWLGAGVFFGLVTIAAFIEEIK